jgi:hypothetical protein
MAFIEWELFHNKRKNLSAYEKTPVNFIAPSPDVIYWKVALSRSDNELDRLRKPPSRFYCKESWGIYWMGALPRSEIEIYRLQ